ncbi:hypothetical protein F0P96_17955 [Hymenobacter busanensis]|uniref:Uncharacterized protein n=1 Tax=Hymenobacter busanensis TaxID=2607656 RepID=A0A7L4ZS10_9BACT|nr:hypothetical protein [Hymenobacter busanensis]KAA9327123.1 hypothetical protein F0P96_17955 [Hymenobacter busanensis]QHJ05788.1 hypothetical protein GUY19_00155 [Hymenobacter busanensis]
MPRLLLHVGLVLSLGLSGGWAARAATAVPDTLPHGRFLRPAVRIGELIDYELVYRHNPALNVVFPDSTADFKPFEYVKRRYWPTLTRQGVSLDRCRYTLRTFALDSTLQLGLPITLLRGQDTLLLRTPPALVRVQFSAPALPPGADLPPLRQNTTPLPVPPRFNYPYWLAAAALLLVVAAIGWWSFGRRLSRRFQLYKLRRNHVYFLAQYARHLERYELSRSLANMERAITLWKNYLTRLEENALNTLTTKEIVAHYENDPDVRTALQLSDRVIYGNQLPDEVADQTDQALELLRRFADRRYASVAAAFLHRPAEASPVNARP